MERVLAFTGSEIPGKYIFFFLIFFLLNEISCLSENTWTPGVLKSRGDRMVTHFSVSFRACININLTCLCTLLD